jgi:hypothetical protein
MGMMMGGHGEKINQDVDFPLEGLDMSKYVIGKNPSTQKG